MADAGKTVFVIYKDREAIAANSQEKNKDDDKIVHSAIGKWFFHREFANPCTKQWERCAPYCAISN